MIESAQENMYSTLSDLKWKTMLSVRQIFIQIYLNQLETNFSIESGPKM